MFCRNKILRHVLWLAAVLMWDSGTLQGQQRAVSQNYQSAQTVLFPAPTAWSTSFLTTNSFNA